jgi:hypothetical protein
MDGVCLFHFMAGFLLCGHIINGEALSPQFEIHLYLLGAFYYLHNENIPVAQIITIFCQEKGWQDFPAR